MRSKVPLFLLLACVSTHAGAYAQEPSIAHVDISATGNDDGTTWEHAFNDLQDALPSPNSYDEVWVAKGTYRPAGPGGSRAAVFHMDPDTAIYGGFPSGGGDGTFAARNIELYETILSGDLNDDDGPIAFQNNSENSYHVITGNLTYSTGVLDGFTITAGNANVFSSPLGPNGVGGGLIVWGTTTGVNAGSPTIRDCTFTLNQAYVGGGAQAYRGSPTLEHCTFWANRALLYGGGFYNTGGDSPHVVQFGGSVIKDCRFVRNTSTQWGAGSCSANSGPQYINCDFVGNAMTGSGTGAIGGGLSIGCGDNCGDPAVVVNSTFARNTALNGNGGGLVNEEGSTVEIHNSVFWDNEDGGGVDESAQIYVQSGSLTVDYSCIEGLSVYSGSNNIGTAPDFLQLGYGEFLNANTRSFGGSDVNDVGNNSEIPSGTTLERDGVDRTMEDPAIGGGDIVDMGAYEFGHPYILAGGAAKTLFKANSFNRYIDPRQESTDGINFDQGIDQVTIVFSEKVREIGGATLSASSFILRETGGESPPTIDCVCVPVSSAAPWEVTLHFDRFVTPRAWLTIIAAVENLSGVVINGSDRITIGFLPGDIDQDGHVGPLDLARFKQYINAIYAIDDFNLPGHDFDFMDLNRDNNINPLDLLRLKQLINGFPPPLSRGRLST